MPTPRRTLPALLVPLAGLAAACGPDDDGGGGGACADIVVGELVITEVFADYAAPPGGSGADDGQEWFEVQNVSGGAIDLQGVTVVHSRPDGSRESTHVMGTLTVEAGGYAVLGNVLPEFVTGHLDYGYGSDLGDLYNTDGGKLELRCGSAVIDTILYDEVTSGRSNGFDGGTPADYQLNDDLAQWCSPPADAAYEFVPANFATPGSTNFDCEVVTPGMCDDGGTMRALVTPAVGDLVITEVHPRPMAVGAADGEWFEVLVTRDVDLNGVGLDRAGDTAAPVVLTSASCLRVTAGSYVVFARNGDTDTNGGLPEVAGEFMFSMVDSGGDVQVVVDTTVLDSYTWASSRSGTAIQLDADVTDAAGNDEPTAWCDATATYGGGDRGTPGLANTQCGGATGTMCMDPDTMAMRPIVTPEIGQLVITEWMPNPDLVLDSAGEWFEVRATADVDLNGLQAGAATLGATPIVGGGTCVEVAAGGYALFARNATPGTEAGTNGIPDQTVEATFGFNLNQSNGTIQIGFGGVQHDSKTWAASTAGVSIQIDADGTQCDAPAGTPSYNGGTDVGTPEQVHTLECP